MNGGKTLASIHYIDCSTPAVAAAVVAGGGMIAVALTAANNSAAAVAERHAAASVVRPLELVSVRRVVGDTAVVVEGWDKETGWHRPQKVRTVQMVPRVAA